MHDECMSTRNNITLLPQVCHEQAGGDTALTSFSTSVFGKSSQLPAEVELIWR